MELIYVSGLIGLLALGYTYFVYPLVMWVWNRFIARGSCLCVSRAINYHEVAVVMSVYNEEKFLKSRIEQIRNMKYGKEVLIVIGSDGSTDNTNRILADLQKKYENVKGFVFPRRGKAATINALIKLLPEHVRYVILTDVKTFSDDNSIEVLISGLQAKDVGLTMPWIKALNSSEGLYFNTEIRLKCYESIVFGYCAGAFGNMYAIKRDLFDPIPENFVVDDLFVTLQIVLKRHNMRVCSNTNSYVVPTDVKQEFQRRRRIATGNWQIIKWMVTKLHQFPLSFLFVLVSHKLLRWLGPLWILSVIASGVLLIVQNTMVIIPLSVLLALILVFRTIRNTIVRFAVLNMALFMGFFDFLFKKQRGTWRPTKREVIL